MFNDLKMICCFLAYISGVGAMTSWTLPVFSFNKYCEALHGQ